jgi:prepilin-type N-terminal cleavage/methylation domain-containing protein
MELDAMKSPLAIIHARLARSGFTLLELLAVIAIIFILLSILLPAGLALRDRSRIKHAAAEAQLIVKGIKAYRSVYGKWPGQTQDVADVTYANCAPVMGALTINETLNPRHMNFIDLPTEGPIAGGYADPWGASYILAMDENEDGSVSVSISGSPFSFATNIPNETVVVISGGPDPADATKRIYSWTR